MKARRYIRIITLGLTLFFQGLIAVEGLAQAEIKIGTVIPEFNEYQNVTVRSIDPDGIRIIHESGTAKIPLERLTPAQREAFGLSAESAAEHRRNLAARAAAEQARQKQATQQTSQTAKPTTKQQNPRYVTSDQIKIYWYKKLPTPRTMDRDYSPAKKAKEAFVAKIRAGFYDLAAEKAAAQYNKEEALSFGDHQRAELCESELARIAQQEAEQQRREDAENARIQSEFMSAQMSRLQFELNRLNSDLNSIRMGIW
jgi:hypothetical protein